MVKVILNETHSLFDAQKELLDSKFGRDNWEVLKVPARGWTLKQMDELAERLEFITVFASPVPYLLSLLSYRSGGESFASSPPPTQVFIFHKESRDSDEYQLVEIGVRYNYSNNL